MDADIDEMNPDLREKFQATPEHLWQRVQKQGTGQSISNPAMRQQIVRRIADYHKGPPSTDNEDQTWTTWTACPSVAEIVTCGQRTPNEKFRHDCEVSTMASDQSDTILGDHTKRLLKSEINRINGPWESREIFLRTHYKLARHDALSLLGQAVILLKEKPYLREDDIRSSTVGVYEKVHVLGLTFSPRGLATRVTFSTRRVGKQVKWVQSKRLTSGSLVVLMSSRDPRICRAAIVAGRPLHLLERNPPEVDLFIPNDQVIDGTTDWIMVEERAAYFEGTKNTLVALQKMSKEPFQMAKYLVDLKSPIEVPSIAYHPSHMDFASICPDTPLVNVLEPWPDLTSSKLDSSQQAALNNMLTRSLSIVQGPPGTGKTFVSIQALQVMLDNMKDDPPIIVTCQTNHALDQLLIHMYNLGYAFVRLGGQSKDEVIKENTLWELRNRVGENEKPGSHVRFGQSAHQQMRQITTRMRELLAPLTPDRDVLEPKALAKLNIISGKVAQFFETGQKDSWVSHDDAHEHENIMAAWLGKQRVEAATVIQQETFLFDIVEDEEDLELEQLEEAEAETAAILESEKFEKLSGEYVELKQRFTALGPKMTFMAATLILEKHVNPWTIAEKQRGSIYKALLMEAKRKTEEIIATMSAQYALAVRARVMAKDQENSTYLQGVKLIGVTTTGFSKYRALLYGLRPHTVLVEEAAETLEGPVIATCLPSVQRLILVGDHKQLRPHCSNRSLEGGIINLNVSMFERMLMNNMEYVMLKLQRRMVPDISRLLWPIYKDQIGDHPLVFDKSNRPDVPGMGKVNTYFFTHEWSEGRDENMSSYNQNEALMILGFIRYLVLNGAKAEQITILSFYHGQRKTIRKLVGNDNNLRRDLKKFKIVTVDSYQGEENDIVILSLVRSNNEGKIGFLSVENRVCVALSRAKCGFYLFGNGQLLATECKLWYKVTSILNPNLTLKAGRRIGYFMPPRCTKHRNRFFVKSPSVWDSNAGGCEVPCKDRLPCGHMCDQLCHPWSHESFNCEKKCAGIVEACGHNCTARCCDPCHCTKCTPKQGIKPVEPRSKKHSAPAANHSNYQGKGRPQQKTVMVGKIVKAELTRKTSVGTRKEENLIDLDAPTELADLIDFSIDDEGKPEIAHPETVEGKLIDF